MYPVVRCHSSRADALEDLGTKAKFWYRDDDTPMLFKAEERGTGEDWAEKIACELAALLGLPHVHYDLAWDIDQDFPGVVCASFAPPPLSLAHGNQLLLILDDTYPGHSEQRYRCSEHTVDAVFEVVHSLRLPVKQWGGDLPAAVETAAAVFAGYLMLDAWIANQDRHHQNWGAVWDGEQLSLAPNFDLGACLARNLSDVERAERLASRDQNRQIPHFARRARSALYAAASDNRPLHTLAAWDAWARRVPTAAEAWRERLLGITDVDVRSVVDEIPPARMSAISRQFTVDLLMYNKERLLTSEAL